MSEQEPRPPAAPQEPWTRRYGFVLFYWLIFVGILGGMAAINELYRPLVEVYFAEWTASVTGSAMQLLGWGGSVNGIRIVNGYCNFRIIDECTAYYPIAIYLAAVMAFPCPWRNKLLGVLIGIPTVIAFNVLRLVSLCYIYKTYPTVFDTIHTLFMQALMIFITIVIWIVWVSFFGQPKRA